MPDRILNEVPVAVLVGPPMPDRILNEKPDKKELPLPFKFGDEAWGWHLHLLKTQLSQTFATGSHGAKRKAIEEKGDEEEVEKCTRPEWILAHNTDMRRLPTGIRSEKCVVRRFRRCANVYLHEPR
jgi:hypothetical protein